MVRGGARGYEESMRRRMQIDGGMDEEREAFENHMANLDEEELER
jgi:hypothetical protein